MSDWKKGDVERRSASVSKDWVIGILVTVVGSLLAIGINNLNLQQEQQSRILSDHEGRIVSVESKNSDFYRRLDSIDAKLDKILGWSKL